MCSVKDKLFLLYMSDQGSLLLWVLARQEVVAALVVVVLSCSSTSARLNAVYKNDLGQST